MFGHGLSGAACLSSYHDKLQHMTSFGRNCHLQQGVAVVQHLQIPINVHFVVLGTHQRPPLSVRFPRFCSQPFQLGHSPQLGETGAIWSLTHQDIHLWNKPQTLRTGLFCMVAPRLVDVSGWSILTQIHTAPERSGCACSPGSQKATTARFRYPYPRSLPR